jgi:flagellar biosynthesis/type III secretory pathway protein FliH
MDKKITELVDKWLSNNFINKEKVTQIKNDLDVALSDVFESAMEDGYDQGHSDGYDEGYDEGFNEAVVFKAAKK